MIEPLEARLPVNWQPLALDDWFVLDEDAPFAIESPGVLANDSDEDEDPLTAFLVDGPEFGDLTFNADGSFTYVPEANFHGQVTFTYRVFDGTEYSNIATVTLTINPINDDPFAVDDAFATDEDTPVILDVLANDSDLDGDDLSVVGFTNPNYGSVSQNQDGTLTYTPNADWHGEDAFEYTVSDGQGGIATGTAFISVAEVDDPGNDAPVAEEDDVITDEDTPITFSLTDNDHDIDGDELEVTGLTDPEHGSVVEGQDGDCTYTPDPNWHGLDSFSYTISDGNGGTATGDVYVLVNSVNDVPIAVNDSFTISEDSGLSMDVLANDSDPADNDPLSIIDITNPQHGTVQYNENGTITYQPNGDYNGPESFEYTAWDGFDGGEATATVSITITPVDDVPIAYHDVYWCYPRLTSAPYWKEVNAPGVMSNDIDYDYGDSGYNFFSLQVQTATVNTSTLNGQLEMHADGSFRFQPNVAVSGWSYFTYTIGDGVSTSPAAQAWIYILPWDPETAEVPVGPPAPPSDLHATDDEYFFTQDDIGGTAKLNDSPELSRFVLYGPPKYGRLEPDDAEGFTLASGTFIYHPDPTYGGNAVGLVRTTVGYVEYSGELSYTGYTATYQVAGADVKLQYSPLSIAIMALKIDQDNPTNRQFTAAGSLLYGGSIPSTADNLNLFVVGVGSALPPVASITWGVGGNGWEQYQPPDNKKMWNVGDIKPIPAEQSGSLSFSVTLTFTNGSMAYASKAFEIGIRTDDAIVVGWINPDWVPLSPAGVSDWILVYFPVDGKIHWSLKPVSAALLASQSQFHYEGLPGQSQLPMTATDRQYLLDWMFKYGGNWKPPPDDFLTDGIIDYDKVAQFRDGEDHTRYKLFNHYQLKYRVMTNADS